MSCERQTEAFKGAGVNKVDGKPSSNVPPLCCVWSALVTSCRTWKNLAAAVIFFLQSMHKISLYATHWPAFLDYDLKVLEAIPTLRENQIFSVKLMTQGDVYFAVNTEN